jgi:hypothetical protein
MKKIYLLSALLTQLGMGLHAQISFQPAVSYYGLGTNTRDITSGDFDGDGHPDIAVSNTFNQTYSIFKGSSAGTYSNTLNSGALAFQPSPIVAVDLNNDLKIDLAYADLNNIIYTMHGTGVGTFTTGSNGSSGNNPLDMVTADFNNDGKPDLATCNSNGGNISIALITSTGTFGSVTNFTVGTFPSAITSGDFNNDGNKDIAFARPYSSIVGILFGNGSGSFSAPTNYVMSGSLDCKKLATADFNNDSNLDLAIANGSNSNVSIMLGSPTGTFAPLTNFTTNTNPTSLVCADIDGDLNIDLAVVNANSVAVLKGYGNGYFYPALNFPVSAGSALEIISLDANSDGKKDLAVTNYSGMSVLLNNSVCTASITANSGTICSGRSFTITPGGASTYTYTGGSAVVTPGTTTSYTVTGTTSGGCVGTAVSTVSVITSPTINAVSSSVSNLCSGNSTNLSVSSWSGPALSSYTWSTGSNATTINVSPTVTTTYSVTVTNNLGCTSNPFAYTQSVNTCFTGTAFNFDGVDDYINTGTSINNALTGTNKITIEAWIKATTNQAGIIVSNLHTGANTGGQFQVRTQPSGTNQVYFDFYIDNSAGTTLLGMTGGAGNPFNINEWHHIAATWDGTVRSTYIDGVLSTSSSSGSLAQFQTCTNNLLIGARTNTFAAMFNGDIDDLRIWRRALCADEINHVKDGELPATYYPDLIAYYKFNQGIVGGNNYSSNSSITNAASSSHTGLIMNTPLTGTSSNFVSGNAAINGNTVSASFTSTCQVISGVHDIKAENGFDLYPNPSYGFITVDLSTTSHVSDYQTISIINALGEIVSTKQAVSNTITLDTEHLTSGIYFIKVEHEHGSAIRKFIKH